MKQFIHLGFNNWVASSKIAVIQVPNSAPAHRFLQVCKEQSKLIDITEGRKTKSIVILETGQIVLSAFSPDTIVGRIEGNDKKQKEASKANKQEKLPRGHAPVAKRQKAGSERG